MTNTQQTQPTDTEMLDWLINQEITIERFHGGDKYTAFLADSREAIASEMMRRRMSEIIPILKLVPVDLPRCDGCYWNDHENDICKEPNKDLEKWGCTTWTIWKEVTK